MVDELAGRPPRAADLARARRFLAYGLVFETTGDGVADYAVGISNDAPRAGDLRVWVTDIAAGQTREQIGGPYGFPVEFSYPDEQDLGMVPTMVFTFLGDSAPRGLTEASRFYAWTSVTDGGMVVGWDYAPDTGWLSRPP